MCAEGPVEFALPVRTMGLLFATLYEAGPVLRSLGLKRRPDGMYERTQGDLRVLVVISGPGPAPAKAGATRLIQEGAQVLYSCGFAGALQAHLQPGDVVADKVVSAERPVMTAEARRLLADVSGANAVDMETDAMRSAAAPHGVPVRLARVISDTLRDDLTMVLGPQGDLAPGAIARRLANPLSWPSAWRLYRQTALARASLTRYLGELIPRL